MIQQVATASEQQSVTVEKINKRVDEINNVTKETAGGAEESATAADNL